MPTSTKRIKAMGIAACVIGMCFLSFAAQTANAQAKPAPILGEVRIFAGDLVPKGWESCEGQALRLRDNTYLFSLVGSDYGGNGRTTFALPDLRDRTPVHVGQGKGLDPVVLAEKKDGKTFNVLKTEHDNSKTQPTLGLTFMIATGGRYPSKDK